MFRATDGKVEPVGENSVNWNGGLASALVSTLAAAYFTLSFWSARTIATESSLYATAGFFPSAIFPRFALSVKRRSSFTRFPCRKFNVSLISPMCTSMN